ncbi:MULTISPECIES: tripartite tricarboxylate transporter TctB family protein [unclassified Ruegeria]|uniref:tripartite tricarboxylate transporter TctB family protein n=1 Tax=unclassified Ruegeria TaxID=2625375 RepID=UPI001492EFE5|nr:MULTISPECIES: tripartite tricarboxylate transporter TctB family protein [unclassified Ruegeria]NOC46028.1 tripartite tricarboxylate transporter TctB family protein [Ruegeria sp. HKCCD7559]NOD84861.1 tripartite tricarboxylate transporter TctB family protein [Ruegeria sp. HKCCD6119]
MSSVSLPRAQHIVASGVIAAVGIWVAWVSYTQQPAEAFLFPRLISTVFVVLALWTFAKALLGWTKVGNGVSRKDFIWLLPGLIIALIYIFWAAKALGFYTAGTITFFLLLSFYDPAPHGEIKTWTRRVIITIGYLAVMYGLFAMLLKVYTPREVFF